MLPVWSLVFGLVNGLTVRTGAVDMTPPEPLTLGGYTARKDARAAPGGDHLYARAVILTQGRKTLAMVSFETLTIPVSLTEEVSQAIPKGVSLFLVATHTHSAPDSQMLNSRMTLGIPGIANFSRRWLDWTAAKLADLVRETLARPGESVAGLQMRQAFVAMNRARRKGAHPDPTFTLISSGSTPLFASFAAHATIYDEHRLKLSGDWPGLFSATTGAAFFPGAIGDMSPAAEGQSEESRILEMVSRSTAALAKVEPRELSGRLRLALAPIDMGAAVPNPTFAKNYGVPEVLAKVMVSKFAEPKASVHAWSLGDLAVIGVPGEPTAAVGREIQAAGKAAGFRSTLVISHCDGWVGYILEPDDYGRGGYEATLAFNGREFASRVVDACRIALSRLRT